MGTKAQSGGMFLNTVLADTPTLCEDLQKLPSNQQGRYPGPHLHKLLNSSALKGESQETEAQRAQQEKCKLEAIMRFCVSGAH